MLDPNDNLLQNVTGLSSAPLRAIITVLDQLENLHVNAWSSEYPLVSSLINTYDLRIGCEIGVAFGTGSQSVLENTDISRLYSIDPYKHFPDSVYPDGMNLEQHTFDVLYLRAQKRLASYGDRSMLLRMTSLDAAELFADNSLDFVYLDGNHTFEGLSADLQKWYDKVRSGGLLIGDDYGHISHPGVKQAVNTFCAQRSLKVNVRSRTWWVIKP